jgi:hypothetical protein
MRTLLLPCVLLFAACARPAHPPSASVPRDELRGMEAALARAVDEGDTDALDALLAPGFALVGEDTTRRVERDVWISNTRLFAFDSVRAEVASTAIRGDTADVALLFRFRVSGPERPPARMVYDLADRWVRSDGTWKLARRRLLSRRTDPP